MTAYAFAGLCYATPAAALPAFKAVYPFQDASFVAYLAPNPAPAISAGGVISYNLVRRNLANNSTTNIATNLQLSVCTRPDVPYDYSTGGAFWAFGFTGVMVLYFTAHSIGLVLKSVKKF